MTLKIEKNKKQTIQMYSHSERDLLYQQGYIPGLFNLFELKRGIRFLELFSEYDQSFKDFFYINKVKPNLRFLGKDEIENNACTLMILGFQFFGFGAWVDFPRYESTYSVEGNNIYPRGGGMRICAINPVHSYEQADRLRQQRAQVSYDYYIENNNGIGVRGYWEDNCREEFLKSHLNVLKQEEYARCLKCLNNIFIKMESQINNAQIKKYYMNKKGGLKI